MSKMSSAIRFNFRRSVSDRDAKQQFHVQAHRQLKRLAVILGLVPSTYDLRSNQGGIAVSGEITLHADNLSVQVSQPAMGFDSGILFR
ncbi:MAG: hypothetical protein KGJ73_07820, partial [Rhodospirillales bacterium]|nr:hypothetical protein [Rhodospirillales bacterium]